AMAYAQSDLKAAPTRLTLQVTVDPLRGQCRRLDASDPIPLGQCPCTGRFTMISTSILCRAGSGYLTTRVVPLGQRRAIGEGTAPTSNGRPLTTANSRST